MSDKFGAVAISVLLLETIQGSAGFRATAESKLVAMRSSFIDFRSEGFVVGG